MALSTLDSITAMHKYEKVGHCAELWEQSMASQKKVFILSMWCGKNTFVIYKRHAIGDHIHTIFGQEL